MINAEADVFDYVYSSAANAVTGLVMKNEYDPVPKSLPFATLIEIDNQTDTRRVDTHDGERFAVLTYEANSYAEDKATCREVAVAIDTAIVRLGFTRLSLQYTPNLADRTVHRATARYRATVGDDLIVYRRT